MITPSYAPHINLEKSAIAFLKQIGYAVFEQTYHASLPKDIVQKLQNNPLVSALYIRSRADRIAITDKRQFEFEVKTHYNQRYNDLTIELFPFLMHYAKRQFIDCLYICQVNLKQFGFWVSNPPKPKFISVPNVPKNKHVAKFIRDNLAIFGNVPVSEKVSNGSNDPYMIVPESAIAAMDNWQDIIRGAVSDELDQQSGENQVYTDWLGG